MNINQINCVIIFLLYTTFLKQEFHFFFYKILNILISCNFKSLVLIIEEGWDSKDEHIFSFNYLKQIYTFLVSIIIIF